MPRKVSEQRPANAKFKVNGEVRSFPTWTIGQIASKLREGRTTQTVKKYEAMGAIEPSRFKVIGKNGKVSRRIYTKGEVDLIVTSFDLWWEEHWREVKNRVPPPSRWRLGQIYHDLKQYLKEDREHFLVFELPEEYKLPPKKFSGTLVAYRKMEKLVLVLRKNPSFRSKCLKLLFNVSSEEELDTLIGELKVARVDNQTGS